MRAFVAMLLILSLAVLFTAGCQDKDAGEEDLTSIQKTPTDPAQPGDPDVSSELDAADVEADDDDAEGADVDAVEESGETAEESGEGSDEGMNEGKPGGPEVVLETTKGNIVLRLHPEWSPFGVAHFMGLVEAGFYDGAPWFRVLDGFVAQCGISAVPEMNQKHGERTIKDEPVIQGNTRGMVAYGKSGPDTRSTHIFINYSDNSRSLDPQGFACFAEVVEGMDIADSLTRCEFGNQGELAAPGGLDKFKQSFPDADYILKAYIKKPSS